jgi:hypothetical protein
MFALLTVQVLVASATLIALGKMGATTNYFIESMGLWSVLTGIAFGLALEPILRVPRTGGWERSRVPAVVLPIALIGQVALAPSPPMAIFGDAQRDRELAGLVRLIHDAPKPVLSEDMALLLRAGKEVPLEPLMFTELAEIGVWDQRPYIEMIDTNAFQFVLLTRNLSRYYEDLGREHRFSRAVLDAIGAHYPIITRDAGFFLYHGPQTP